MCDIAPIFELGVQRTHPVFRYFFVASNLSKVPRSMSSSSERRTCQRWTAEVRGSVSSLFMSIQYKCFGVHFELILDTKHGSFKASPCLRFWHSCYLVFPDTNDFERGCFVTKNNFNDAILLFLPNSDQLSSKVLRIGECLWKGSTCVLSDQLARVVLQSVLAAYKICNVLQCNVTSV